MNFTKKKSGKTVSYYMTRDPLGKPENSQYPLLRVKENPNGTRHVLLYPNDPYQEDLGSFPAGTEVTIETYQYEVFIKVSGKLLKSLDVSSCSRCGRWQTHTHGDLKGSCFRCVPRWKNCRGEQCAYCNPDYSPNQSRTLKAYTVFIELTEGRGVVTGMFRTYLPSEAQKLAYIYLLDSRVETTNYANEIANEWIVETVTSSEDYWAPAVPESYL